MGRRNGNGIPLYNAVTGEQVAISDTEGLNFEQALTTEEQ
jgi:oxepin-CoA hydrolase/3-oxo-5,6-dehydrosuberyl-CoA semialdehyde dehydrogenase